MMRALVLGAAALALSVGAASGQAGSSYEPYNYGYPAGAPLYDYVAPAPVHAAPHRYGPLVYSAPVYAPSPAFPAPQTTPGYYAAGSVVVSQPLYDYPRGYWGR